jgi:hypothetical protein
MINIFYSFSKCFTWLFVQRFQLVKSNHLCVFKLFLAIFTLIHTFSDFVCACRNRSVISRFTYLFLISSSFIFILFSRGFCCNIETLLKYVDIIVTWLFYWRSATGYRTYHSFMFALFSKIDSNLWLHQIKLITCNIALTFFFGLLW